MESEVVITGECFCGEVKYQINGVLRDARSCHCWLFQISSGLPDIGIELCKIKLASDEEDYRPHGIHSGISTSLAFGGLKQPVYGLQEAV